MKESESSSSPLLPPAERPHPLDLDAIKARERAATPAPWFQGPHYQADVYSCQGVIRANCWNAPQCIADAQFIAHARQDIPALIAEVERLRAAPEAPAHQLDDELELRKGWWINHGCPFAALYGDDGEMQCSQCGIDFKYLPLARLARTLIALGRLHAGIVPAPAHPPELDALRQQLMKHAAMHRKTAKADRMAAAMLGSHRWSRHQADGMDTTADIHERFAAELDALLGQMSAAPAHPPEYPIPLNAEQELAAKQWAADDRLWTTQETVEFNLRTFARTILKLGAAPAVPPTPPADDGQVK